MVRLARKAFHPGKVPFSLLHIDTTYKFHEMIAFRTDFVRDTEAGRRIRRRIRRRQAP